MSGALDLSQLSDAQLQALKGAGGDLTKLPDDMLQGIQASLTPKVDPNSAAAGRAALENSGDPRFAPAANTVPQANTWQRLIGQGAQHFNDTVADAALALPDASAWVSRKLGLVPENTPRPSDVAKQGIDYIATAPGRVGDAVATGSTAPLTDNRTSRFEAATPEERLAGDVGGGVGSVFGSLVPLSLINKAVGGAGKVGRVTTALSSNPGMQAVSNIVGNVTGDVTGDPRLGMVAAMATPAGLQGAKRIVSAAPAATTQEAERRSLLAYGQSIGAPQTAGKILDSQKLQAGESAVSKLPLPGLGGRVQATEEANRNAWQKAILEKAGIAGETAATPNVTRAAFDRLGQKFENLTSNSTINVTPQFGQKLDQIKTEYGDRLFEDVQPGLMKRINELSKAPAALAQSGNPSVTLDGKTYQNIRSDLSRIAGTATKPADRRAAGAMVTALDDMAEKSLPADVMDEWKQTRQQYRNLLAISKAVGGANNPSTAVGNIPTAAFARAAKGNRDLELPARYGNAFVGDKIPNSGTAERMGWGHLLGGGAAAVEGYQHAPGMTAAAAGAAALPYAFDLGLNNPLTRALLLRRLANPSQSIAKPGLFGALAGQQAIENSR